MQQSGKLATNTEPSSPTKMMVGFCIETMNASTSRATIVSEACDDVGVEVEEGCVGIRLLAVPV